MVDVPIHALLRCVSHRPQVLNQGFGILHIRKCYILALKAQAAPMTRAMHTAHARLAAIDGIAPVHLVEQAEKLVAVASDGVIVVQG